MGSPWGASAAAAAVAMVGKALHQAAAVLDTAWPIQNPSSPVLHCSLDPSPSLSTSPAATPSLTTPSSPTPFPPPLSLSTPSHRLHLSCPSLALALAQALTTPFPQQQRPPLTPSPVPCSLRTQQKMAVGKLLQAWEVDPLRCWSLPHCFKVRVCNQLTPKQDHSHAPSSVPGGGPLLRIPQHGLSLAGQLLRGLRLARAQCLGAPGRRGGSPVAYPALPVAPRRQASG